MKKPTICRKEAEKQIQQFKDANGFEDPKAVVSDGKESSLPAEVTTMLLANIMAGHTEIVDGGKKIIHHLREPIDDRKTVEFVPRRMKHHEIRDAQNEGTTDEEKMMGLIRAYAGLSTYEFSMLVGKDTEALAAIVMHLNFI